jgi:hypothetical protein
VADQVLEGAEQTAAILRSLAQRPRENGVFANERLARFVRVANQCADIARSMQRSVERRDEQVPPKPKKVEAAAEQEPGLAEVDDAPDLTEEQAANAAAKKANGRKTNGAKHLCGHRELK